MKPLIDLKNIVKIYDNGVVANNGVNFSVKKGEIHALVGENGAGKSTLMKILYGMEKPTDGEIWVNGEQKKFNSSIDAIAATIGMVHQSFMLVPSFTVAENVVLGDEPRKNGLIDREEVLKITKDLSEQFGLFVRPDAVVDSINVGMRQRVEILKTLYRKAEILILDEPTAVLTPQETDVLFKAIRLLVKQGKTVIFITHKLREVKEISDRVTVMRRGKIVGTVDTKDVTREQMANMMVGREVFFAIDKPKIKRGKKRMVVNNLSYVSETGRAILRNIKFNLFSGEILGIAGVEGNGQTELVEVLTGLKPAANGTVFVGEKDVISCTPREIRSQKVAHIPEDRLTNGVAVRLTIEENLIIDRYFKKPIKNGLFMNYTVVKNEGETLIKKFGILTPDGKLPVSSLSGGNMQKVIVAREFSSNPNVLIASQPTRGIDVGATEFVREQLVEIRNNGAAILLVSADLSEVMSLADRIITLYEGEITGVFPDASKVDEKELGLYMLGIKHQTNEEMEKNL
ncbi:MAG: ABC transporter ATP-binding protein [Candidatus Gerdarchaeota archaeon]|nr:MAG: ABC transporter ATP-binding protein [Candidatus Gerdarchaeota archaeon]